MLLNAQSSHHGEIFDDDGVDGTRRRLQVSSENPAAKFPAHAFRTDHITVYLQKEAEHHFLLAILHEETILAEDVTNSAGGYL